MTMIKKYKILGKYIKDMSSETPDIETYIFVREYISKYQLNIDINSKALKDKMIEVNTILKFEDKQKNKKKFLEIGNMIKNPKISVANPGIIRRRAANAIAAPEIISYVGASFFLNWLNPAFRVFKPSYLA